MAGEVMKATSLITANTFSAKFESGHVAFMGGEAPRPTELVTAGLAGCAGLTFKGVLDKMGVAYDRIVVDIEAQRAAERPTVFTGFKVVFHVWGKDLKPERVQRALEMAEKYCPVLQTLVKACPVESSFVIETC